MRRPFLWAMLLLLLLSAAGAQATEYPYVAYISSDDVYIRSGPGKNYYPTAKLKRGEPIEVYRHDPGGWYAIRPPVQSFSWVSARQLDVLDDGLASVNTDRAVARVGSLFSEVRDVIQVRLNKNERVELVDTHASADEKWYKIAPPAGEFRWVYKDYVTRRAPLGELAEGEQADDEPEERPRRRSGKQRRAADEIRLTSADRDGADRDGEDRDSIDRDSAGPDRDAAADLPVDRPRRISRRGPAADDRKSFIAALADIDLDLSAMVAEEITTWSFSDLRLRTERVMRRAPTAIERGQAQQLLNKIDRFDRLKARQDALLEAPAGGSLAGSAAERAAIARHDELTNPRFDVTGTLSQVAPRKEGAPPFVLLDRRGNVVSYVTPAPNINLRPYVDRQVGINGQRGFMPEMQKSHITAQHITVLADEPHHPSVANRPARP
ncbi:MAG TPA: hypothetical protein VHY91_24485 [Pirellulales bacterium]|jgi:uncharacterized protein YgiM (DUF1202 family)|nr:hypothetical protein [Pirellulales bacterium]